MSYGMTLLELLIALLISLLILTMLATTYVTTEKNHQTQNALTTIQENAHTAIEFLRTDLHLAGNIGCGKLRADFPLKNVNLTLENKVTATEQTITIRGASAERADLLEAMQSESLLYVSAEPRFKTGDSVMISNCNSAEVFTVSQADVVNSNSQKIIATNPLSQRYPKTASLSKYMEKTYFIENSALYVKDGMQPSQELVRGVKVMEVTFALQSVAIKFILQAENGLQKTWFLNVNLDSAP